MRHGMATVTLAGLAMVSSGCISLLGPEDLRFRLSLSQGVGLDRQFAIGVDGLTIRAAAALAGPDLPIRGLTWADVGVYRIRGDRQNLLANVELPGYETMVRVRDGSDEVRVFVQQGTTAVNGLVLLARENDQLVIVRVRGRIDQLLESVLQKGDFDLDFEEIEKSVEQPQVVRVPADVQQLVLGYEAAFGLRTSRTGSIVQPRA